jgi:hypothetical protein
LFLHLGLLGLDFDPKIVFPLSHTVKTDRGM